MKTKTTKDYKINKTVVWFLKSKKTTKLNKGEKCTLLILFTTTSLPAHRVSKGVVESERKKANRELN